MVTPVFVGCHLSQIVVVLNNLSQTLHRSCENRDTWNLNTDRSRYLQISVLHID